MVNPLISLTFDVGYKGVIRQGAYVQASLHTWRSAKSVFLLATPRNWSQESPEAVETSHGETRLVCETSVFAHMGESNTGTVPRKLSKLHFIIWTGWVELFGSNMHKMFVKKRICNEQYFILKRKILHYTDLILCETKSPPPPSHIRFDYTWTESASKIHAHKWSILRSLAPKRA